MCVESMSFTSTALTYIALNALEILQLVLTVSTYIAFKNQLNTKKVMDRNLCTVCRATNTSVFVLTNNIAYTITFHALIFVSTSVATLHGTYSLLVNILT